MSTSDVLRVGQIYIEYRDTNNQHNNRMLSEKQDCFLVRIRTDLKVTGTHV